MTIRVTHAVDEKEAETKIKEQYKGFDYVFLKKVKKDESEDYIYYFDIVDCTIQ